MVNIRGCYSYLTKTLQDKIDVIFELQRSKKIWIDEYLDMNSEDIADSRIGINKAIQELREEIKAMPENHSNSWLWKQKVLSLIGEKK